MEVIVEILKYILFGFIQGFLEILPISSSGHVAFLQEIISLEIDGSIFFLIIINLGSVFAIIYFLRKDIKILLVNFFKYTFAKNRDKEVKKSVYYIRNIIIGIVPIVLFGIFLNQLLSKIYEINPLLIIGVGSLMTATALYLVRNITNYHINQEFTGKDSLFIGLAQLISIFPGLSRLGFTTAAGLNRKLSMDSALKFSFLMGIPVSIGAILPEIISYDFLAESMTNGFDFTNYVHYIYYFVGFATSLITTFFAIKWIFIWFRRGNLTFFYIYNFVFGMILIFIGISR